MRATDVTGLVIEAIRKIASVFIGACFSRSRKPNASKKASFPWRAIRTTAPGISPFSTPIRKASLTRPSRSDEKPRSSGLSHFGNPPSPIDLFSVILVCQRDGNSRLCKLTHFGNPVTESWLAPIQGTHPRRLVNYSEVTLARDLPPGELESLWEIPVSLVKHRTQIGHIPITPFYKRGCQDKCFPNGGKTKVKWSCRPARVR